MPWTAGIERIQTCSARSTAAQDAENPNAIIIERIIVNQADFGEVSGPSDRLKVRFDDYLLLEAVPVPTESQ